MTVVLTRRRLLELCFGAGVSALAGCGGGHGGGAGGPSSPSVVVEWDNAALAAIRATKPGPPIVARDLAIVHTAIFDAWAAYDANAVGSRLGGTLRRPASERTPANKTRALSYAAYRALVDLFPTQQATFDAEMAALGYDPADTSTDPTTPSGIGNRAAQALLAFRHSDGANQLGDLHPGAYSDYTGYTPVNTPDAITDPNRWQPLRVSDGHGGSVVQNCVGMQWGRVVPFGLASADQFRPGPPPQYGTAEYAADVQEIVSLSAGLTDEQKMIAEYWADGPNSELPPGHWCLIAQFVSARDRHDLDADVKLFFMVSNAVFDAGIACWDAKRAYDFIRPISAIHYVYNGQLISAWGGPGQGARMIRGEDWQPYQAVTVVTPPFQEYISGHSTFSAAAAEVLKRFTGSDAYGNSVTFPAGSSKFEAGLVPARAVTLEWATFSDAADQAGLSRRYGGIHFQHGDYGGRAVGRQVGGAVWDKALSYINGTATPP